MTLAGFEHIQVNDFGNRRVAKRRVRRDPNDGDVSSEPSAQLGHNDVARPRLLLGPDQDQLAPYQPKGATPGPRGQGPLDLVIRPIDPKSRAPSAQPQPGESIAEWLWLERAQIQLLRRSALVIVER